MKNPKETTCLDCLYCKQYQNKVNIYCYFRGIEKEPLKTCGELKIWDKDELGISDAEIDKMIADRKTQKRCIQMICLKIGLGLIPII
ncbi:MAG: hypothetical protein LHV68_05050 [Elusimicrobia bacterium]|nr:hypothetical protein [Candidatus Liberimonas magnetica]